MCTCVCVLLKSTVDRWASGLVQFFTVVFPVPHITLPFFLVAAWRAAV